MTHPSSVIWLGFEPRTHSLEGCCSIQLSYQTVSECKIKFFFMILQITDILITAADWHEGACSGISRSEMLAAIKYHK